jgi:hypothetical protein
MSWSLVAGQLGLLLRLLLAKWALMLFSPIALSHLSTKLAVKVSCPMRFMHCGALVWT